MADKKTPFVGGIPQDKKSYAPDPKPVKTPKKGKRTKPATVKR